MQRVSSGDTVSAYKDATICLSSSQTPGNQQTSNLPSSLPTSVLYNVPVLPGQRCSAFPFIKTCFLTDIQHEKVIFSQMCNQSLAGGAAGRDGAPACPAAPPACTPSLCRKLVVFPLHLAPLSWSTRLAWWIPGFGAL